MVLIMYSRMSIYNPRLSRCITSHKVEYAEYLIESLFPQERNTNILIEIGTTSRLNDKCVAHYIHIDKDGNRILKTEEYDGDMEDVKGKFNISLLAIKEK